MRQKLIPLLLCLLMWPCCAAGAEDAGTILTGKVVTAVSRAVRMPFNAVVEKVLVQPGTRVEVDTPLMRYALQDEAERLLQREVTNGAGTEQLKSQVLDMQEQLSALEANRNKTRHLVSTGLGSRQALALQEGSVSSLIDRIRLTREIINKQESNFKARLVELSGYYGQPIKAGEALPKLLTLTSPIAGYVLSVAPALNPGQLLMAGTAPIQVGQLNPVLIQVPVYEAEINSIAVGDTATVEIPSLNNRKFKGTVSEISWMSTDMNVANPSYYTVELTVENPELVLKPGFKTIVRFSGKDTERRR